MEQLHMEVERLPSPRLIMYPNRDKSQLEGDYFVSPEFNIVFIIGLAILLLSTKKRYLGCLVDGFAAIYLLYGTYSRKEILRETGWGSDATAAKSPADQQIVYDFLVLSLVSWVASVMLEYRSVEFLLKTGLRRYCVNNLRKKDVGALLLSLVTSANACFVMLSFSSDVHRSFENLTDDPWILFYFNLAALAKNSRVFFQGLVFTSWIATQPWTCIHQEDKRKRGIMARMWFSNSVMFVQAGLLMLTFLHNRNVWNIKFITLLIDVIYRGILCFWFSRNSYCCLEELKVTICSFPKDLWNDLMGIPQTVYVSVTQTFTRLCVKLCNCTIYLIWLVINHFRVHHHAERDTNRNYPCDQEERMSVQGSEMVLINSTLVDPPYDPSHQQCQALTQAHETQEQAGTIQPKLFQVQAYQDNFQTSVEPLGSCEYLLPHPESSIEHADTNHAVYPNRSELVT